MSPCQVIQDKYAANPQEESFDWYLRWHLHHGFVFATPAFFVMGRPQVRAELLRAGPNFDVVTKDEADTWYVHAMAGDCSQAWSILPYALPWMAWERVRGGVLDLQVFEFSRVHRLSHVSTGIYTVQT